MRLAAGSLRAAVRPELDGGQRPRGLSEPEEGAALVPDPTAGRAPPGAAVTECTRSGRALGSYPDTKRLTNKPLPLLLSLNAV